MKNKLAIEPPEDATCLLFVGATEAVARNAKRAEGNSTRTYHLVARLEPSQGRHSRGRVEYSMNVDDATYRIEAEVMIPFEDFAALGLDPEGGFDDEEVMLTIANLALALELNPARIERRGVVFAVEDVGRGLFLHKGDKVALEVHKKRAARGVF